MMNKDVREKRESYRINGTERGRIKGKRNGMKENEREEWKIKDDM